jgi:hypothetical protein
MMFLSLISLDINAQMKKRRTTKKAEKQGRKKTENGQ